MNQQKQNVEKSTKKTETDAASVIIPIVQEKYDYVFKLFLRKTGNRHDAADLTQELFTRLIGYCENLQHPEAIDSYIYTTACHCLSDFYDYDNKISEIKKAAQDHTYESEVDELEPSKLAEKGEISARLNEIFLSLPGMCFECVCMRYIEGLDYKEIAKKLNISVNSVGVYLMRARDMLRENPFVRSLLEDD